MHILYIFITASCFAGSKTVCFYEHSAGGVDGGIDAGA